MAIDVDGRELESGTPFLYWERTDLYKPLLVRRLEANGFNEQQIDTILTIMANTCPACWDSPRGCYCTRDD